VTEARRITLDLLTCANVVSDAHLAMQQQRLLHDTDTVCVDDLDEPGRRAALVRRLNARIDEERRAGDDLVLSIVLNRDDADEAVAEALESALQDVLVEERTKTSPRAIGAVVYDSNSFDQRIPEVKPYLLWCPAALGIDDLAELVDPSVLNQLFHCAVSLDVAVPIDLPEPLDRLTIAQLPLLATRRQFLNYVARYGEGAVGETTGITVLAPRRSADARDVVVGDRFGFGDLLDPLSPFSSTDIATFFDDEYLTVLPDEALSVCAGDASGHVVAQADLAEEPLPLDALPARHADDPRPRYQLGLRWDGAFYLRFDYRAVLGTTTEVVGLTLPFSPSLPGNVSFREQLWTAATFDLRDELTKCRRFCDHPTFDSAGIYQVQALFAPTYQNDCYAPRFPTPDDGGFPDDP